MFKKRFFIIRLNIILKRTTITLDYNRPFSSVKNAYPRYSTKVSSIEAKPTNC